MRVALTFLLLMSCKPSEPTGYDAPPEFVMAPAEGEILALVAAARKEALAQKRQLLVYVGAPWCEPCREEMPGFQSQAAQHAAHDWVFVGVSVMEPAEAVEEFRDEFPLTFPLALDESGRVSRQYLVQGTPTNIVIDREGCVVDRRLGYMSEDEIAAMIASVP